MSAIVCGKRSNLFEDFQSSLSSPSPPSPVSKRIRRTFSPARSSSDPDRVLSGNSIASSALDHLLMVFSDMDKQLVERALRESGDDLDSAIKCLNELRLGSGDNLRPVAGSSGATHESSSHFFTQGAATTNGDTTSAEDLSAAKVVHLGGTEWVDLFVGEMMSASNIDDAKARASRALEAFEKAICARATEAACGFQQENMMLKQQFEALTQENAILKRVVAIQHERQKEFEDKGNELNQLKQSVAQYQEQLRTLEVNNYALSMHLKQAQQSNNSIPGRFNPDVF
ncbi:uncharacterized protein LOC129871226 [Solanum dulcamara]|uniref:uncharacterized protein LOC129871226 n=1 Tax=Solanum dulcamara TaxID=45834 RepID=UPI002486A22F|nr:uncharacterized protein LOC129871226 [Solanum dulcamara]